MTPAELFAVQQSTDEKVHYLVQRFAALTDHEFVQLVRDEEKDRRVFNHQHWHNMVAREIQLRALLAGRVA